MAAFVVAGRDGAEVFKTVDGALDDVASFVGLGIESWWRTATFAFAKPVFSRVLTLGTDAPHAALLDLLSIVARAISTVYTQAGRPFTRASPAGTGHTDGIEHRSDLGCVAALPGSGQDRQGQTVPIDTQVDLAGDAAA